MSNRPTAITPATARAGGLGCETEERNTAKKSTQTRALFCIGNSLSVIPVDGIDDGTEIHIGNGKRSLLFKAGGEHEQ